MTRRRLIEYLHDLARIERYRILKPLHRHAGEHALFAFDRDRVARGVAVGFFFGILTPVAQIVFAIVAAITLRANLVVAVTSTLITNPFSLPFVYYFAYRIGSALTGRTAALAADAAVSEKAAERALDVGDWVPTLLAWVSSVGIPLMIGVLSLAMTAALLGYLLVHAGWALWAVIDRHRKRAAGESPP
jgi:uncharacterized protein